MTWRKMVRITPAAAKTHDVFAPDKKSPIFPSTRLFMACLLCMCFISLSVATSNLSVSLVYMVKKNHTEEVTNSSCPISSDVDVKPCTERERLEWSGFDQGIVLAAQNVGSLTMLISGSQADRLNGKWTICLALSFIVLSNAIIPVVAHTSVWLVFLFRVMTGMGDAFLFPSANSMITRWFPPKERPFAVGFVTGGRQIGALLISPLAGYLSAHSGGWQSVFWLSAGIGGSILVLWTLLSADKPTKHCCVRRHECAYIERKIEEEQLGKRTSRPSPPWRKILTSRPILVAVAALVCHEFPLVIMISLLPRYFNDILALTSTELGVVSAAPTAVLWISKTLSSSLSSAITARKSSTLSKTRMCKIFNLIGSLGLGICVGITPFVRGNKVIAITALCAANGFAGLHTPGVQTALVQLAPAYTGVVTGIAFSTVAVFSILNKIISMVIVKDGTMAQWTVVFVISAVVALLPVVFFTLWGSADRQPWASPQGKSDDTTSQSSTSTGSSSTSATTVSTDGDEEKEEEEEKGQKEQREQV